MATVLWDCQKVIDYFERDKNITSAHNALLLDRLKIELHEKITELRCKIKMVYSEI